MGYKFGIALFKENTVQQSICVNCKNQSLMVDHTKSLWVCSCCNRSWPRNIAQRPYEDVVIDPYYIDFFQLLYYLTPGIAWLVLMVFSLNTLNNDLFFLSRLMALFAAFGLVNLVYTYVSRKMFKSGLFFIVPALMFLYYCIWGDFIFEAVLVPLPPPM